MRPPRGQVSLEFLFLLTLGLALLAAVSINLARTSIDSTVDIAKVGEARMVVDRIASAINSVGSEGPGAKRTIHYYLTRDLSEIGVNSTHVYARANLSDGRIEEVNAKLLYPASSISLNATRGEHSVAIEWIPGEEKISVRVLR